MATNGLLNFQGTNKATFVGATSNITLDVVNSSLGIGITGTDPPSSNLYITGNAYVTSDISVGGVLNMGVVNVAARHNLEAVTSLGASTPSTLTLTNTGTSLVASGDVTVGSLVASGDVTVDTNTFHVDTTNSRVGVGTTSPDGPLHISKSAPYNGDTGPGILFTRYANTYGGCIWNESNNDIDGLYFNAVNNVAGAGYGSTPKMVINSNGNVGVGMNSPDAPLDVQGIVNIRGGGTSAAPVVNLRFSYSTNPHSYSHSIRSAHNGGDAHGNRLDFHLHRGSAQTATDDGDKRTMEVRGDGYVLISNGLTVAGSGVTSDDRIKFDEENVSNALTLMSQLTPQKYEKIIGTLGKKGTWIPTDEEWESVKSEYDYKSEFGFIAQDVRRIPELSFLVSGDEVDEEGNQTPLGLNYQGIFVVAVKAIQELNTELQAEKEKTRALEDKVEALEDHLTRFIVQVTARLASQK